MRKTPSLAALLLSATILVACSSNQQQIEEGSVQHLYQKGQTYLQNGDYHNAIRYLEASENRYPYGEFSEQIALNLIYAYYQSGDYTMALSTAEHFLRTYKNSSHLDYVLFLAGLTNSALGDNFMQDLLRIDRAGSDISTINNAFHNFQTVITYFPNSPYAQEALARATYLKERLARHELKIAQFYLKRHAYVAVVNRVKEMLIKFADTQAMLEALPLMEKAYKEMGLTDMQQQTQRLIEANKQTQPTAPVAKPNNTTIPAPQA